MFLEGESKFEGRYALLSGYTITHDPSVVNRAAPVAAYTSLAIIIGVERCSDSEAKTTATPFSYLGITTAE